MSKSFTLNQLTEGIRDRHVGQEATRIQEKWTRTGLLRGLQSHNRENMSRLLENQAAQVLREANTLGSSGADSGQMDGFSNIAFPIVRRVFGGLVANELVSIQPMSLPSGLLFYLDYTYGSDVGGDSTNGAGTNVTFEQGQSIYGNPAGASVRTGANATGGQYDLVGSSYSQVHGSRKMRGARTVADAAGTSTLLASGAFGGGASQSYAVSAYITTSGSDGKLLQFDLQIVNDIENNSGRYSFLILSASEFTSETSGHAGARMDDSQIKSLALRSGKTSGIVGLNDIPAAIQAGNGIKNIRRLNQLGTWANSRFTPDAMKTITDSDAAILVVVSGSHKQFAAIRSPELTGSFVISDSVNAAGGTGGALTIPTFESDFAATPSPVIPEIDIKIESIAVTATTRKLRARWSPELAQDLNAYHSMDAEVELTQILSEQIALEIDREILNDLLTQAKGANFYWSRAPGKFVNKQNGQSQNLASSLATGPQFTGTVREWYETLVETIIDVANEIHRKTLRGSANFIVVSPEVATIFEASVLYKPNLKIDGQGQVALGNIGAESIGSLSNRFTVYKDPYFPRNKILVGYKGGSYLESGYVYAPYVPLIVTPTIFAPEDFTPRKGVMTRYGKKMVRADFYGTVTCLDMDII